MEHLNYEFDAEEGDVVEVSLDRAANVILVDAANYEIYKKGGKFQYRGGYATESPFRVKVPRRGRWHVVIDLGGGAGQVRAAFQLLAGSPATSVPA